MENNWREGERAPLTVLRRMSQRIMKPTITVSTTLLVNPFRPYRINGGQRHHSSTSLNGFPCHSLFYRSKTMSDPHQRTHDWSVTHCWSNHGIRLLFTAIISTVSGGEEAIRALININPFLFHRSTTSNSHVPSCPDQDVYSWLIYK